MARVLLVAKGPPDRGGIAAFVDAIIHSELSGRHHIELLNLTRPETPRSGRFTFSNVRRTISDARALWRAAPLYDVIHIHTALVPLVTLVRAGLLAAVARGRRKPVIVHAHSGKVQRWLVSGVRHALARTLLSPATMVVAVSRGAYEALCRAVAPARLRVVDNGVDIERFVPAPARAGTGPVRILYAGVLTPRKGLLDLFTAAAMLGDGDARGENGVELVVAGGTPDEGPDAEAEVRAAAPPGTVFAGPQPHDAMLGLYHEADVFCLPSWWEAMPLSVLEAAACGLPVVATDVGDIPRAVLDGVTGAVVPPKDPGALAGALSGLVRDPDRRTAFGAAGRRHVSAHFSASRTWRALDALYAQLAPARPDGARAPNLERG